jgi:hypothetical protein
VATAAPAPALPCITIRSLPVTPGRRAAVRIAGAVFIGLGPLGLIRQIAAKPACIGHLPEPGRWPASIPKPG